MAYGEPPIEGNGTDMTVRPVTAMLPVNAEEARAMMAAYTELCAAILDPDDIQGIPGKADSFIKRSGYTKLATFYKLSTEILTVEVVHDDENEEWPGKPLRAHALVRATHPNGRYADGDGSCAATEPRFRNQKGREKLEHDLHATAVTRAFNRAVSTLVGFGSVSAEEADAGEIRSSSPMPSGNWDRLAHGPKATAQEEAAVVRAVNDLGVNLEIAVLPIEQKFGYLPRSAAWAIMLIARAAVNPDTGETE